MNAAAETGVILKPTWSGLLPVFLHLYENGLDAQKQTAHRELQRMARAADVAVASDGLVAAAKELIAAIELHRDCMSGEIHRGDALDESIERVNHAIAECEAAHG